jgi:DNA (cytosine-5)-methyltransferase 1
MALTLRHRAVDVRSVASGARTTLGVILAFTFTDLFAGIGGFHHVLGGLGGTCVFASEIDPLAAAVYERNWGMRPEGDLIPLTEERMAVPEHNVLCAGFPCQPFSKSGLQRGMHETRGTLFWNILRILDERRPAVVVLENVRNLAGPRHRETWDTIIRSLRGLGYAVPSDPVVFSPHWLPPEMGGTPQVRERVFLIGVQVGRARAMRERPLVPVARGPVDGWDPRDWDLAVDLPLEDDASIPDLARYRLTEDEERWIDVWDDLIGRLDCEKLPGFPIWADHFVERPDIPAGTPSWKADFLEKNAAFYRQHQQVIDDWLVRHDRLSALPPSRRKLEWQAQDTDRSLRNCILHFRPSGIRAKKPTYVPALVAITQTTVLGARGRRLTPREAARLQGLPDTFGFGDQADAATYRQLGNGVAAGAVRHVVVQALSMFADDLPAGLAQVCDLANIGCQHPGPAVIAA